MALAPGYPEARLCVAFSGGVDSLALLHAVRELAARWPALSLRAIHVNHGLQDAADHWSGYCREHCQRLAVPLDVVELKLKVAKGESVEAEARRERYAALAARLQPGECLLTAHHADDQLETVLLQLIRGAGVAGLAAMPDSAPLGRGLHLRPLLDLGRDQLVAYAEALGLEWIEDPMNTEGRYDRAYLRQQVLPALRRRWPSIAQTVGRSARHLGAAKRLLEALAQADGAPLVDDQVRLGIAGLVALPRERQVNVLRWWIAEQGLGMPSTARLESILKDVVLARGDAHPVVTWPTGEVRRYRGRLYAMSPLGPLPARGWFAMIKPGETVRLPCALGTLALIADRAASFANEDRSGSFTVRFGLVAAHFDEAEHRPQERALNHALKGHPAWARARLPILLSDQTVLAVGESWLTCDQATSNPAPPLSIHWDCPWSVRTRRSGS